MGTNTTKLGLLKPSENDFYNQQTEQADNWDKVDKFADDIQKNVDFNLLATLGIEYGGILNNTEAKAAGKAYYDTVGKKLYKCIANTSINYADAGFFEAISNNDLLGKLNNLVIKSSKDGFQIIDILGFKVHYKDISLTSTTQRFVIPEVNKVLGYSIVPYDGVGCTSAINVVSKNVIEAKLNQSSAAHLSLLLVFSL